MGSGQRRRPKIERVVASGAGDPELTVAARPPRWKHLYRQAQQRFGWTPTEIGELTPRQLHLALNYEPDPGDAVRLPSGQAEAYARSAQRRRAEAREQFESLIEEQVERRRAEALIANTTSGTEESPRASA